MIIYQSKAHCDILVVKVKLIMPHFAAADVTVTSCAAGLFFTLLQFPTDSIFLFSPHNFNVPAQQLKHLARHSGDIFFFNALIGPEDRAINKSISKVNQEQFPKKAEKCCGKCRDKAMSIIHKKTKKNKKTEAV